MDCYKTFATYSLRLVTQYYVIKPIVIFACIRPLSEIWSHIVGNLPVPHHVIHMPATAVLSNFVFMYFYSKHH